jgi:hypothetical protein
MQPHDTLKKVLRRVIVNEVMTMTGQFDTLFHEFRVRTENNTRSESTMTKFMHRNQTRQDFVKLNG